MREGGQDGDTEDVTSRKDLLVGDTRPTVTPLWAERGKDEEGKESIIDTDSPHEEATTYENRGFEQERASPGEGSQASAGGHSAREHKSSTGDTASGSAPEHTHDVRIIS